MGQDKLLLIKEEIYGIIITDGRPFTWKIVNISPGIYIILEMKDYTMEIFRDNIIFEISRNLEAIELL